MAKNNRFDDLFSTNPDDPLPSKTVAKRNNPDYVCSTFYLPKDLHRKLKFESVAQELQMSEIVQRALRQWFE